ncbi:MAG: glycoside hydrolase family 18 protein [Epulopiscium sp.]|nr:glycoside hydrolase family 18 protein [Candidatus Epulonipiscium sp.]
MKGSRTKRWLALVLSVMMVLSVTPVFADGQVKGSGENKKVITYLPCWGSKQWKVEDIQGDKLTHVYLSFARINNNFEISDTEVRIHTEGGDYPMPDIISSEMIIAETWDKVAKLQKKYPHLKFIIAVGGWEAEGFSDMVANAANREVFVDSVVDYVKKHNLDGVDLDWEFPVNGAWGVIKSRPEDKENFTELIKLLRKKLGTNKEISFCANVSTWFFDAVELDKLVPIVNSVNLMTYDMRGAWEESAFHSAGLYRNPEEPQDWGLSVSETVDRYLEHVPADKLIVGVPTYGKEYRNIEPGPNGDGLFQPFIKDEDGNMTTDKFTWRGSSIPYEYLNKYYIDKNGFTRYWDDVAKAPYLYDGQTFISYDDKDSIRAKSEYIKEKDLGGIMYWEYVNDINGELLSVMSEVLR